MIKWPTNNESRTDEPFPDSQHTHSLHTWMVPQKVTDKLHNQLPVLPGSQYI